jgi:DNA-binding NtrC family response regulator
VAHLEITRRRLEPVSPPRVPVLIVDPEQSAHRALDRTLRREPYELFHAAGAGEAEAILAQYPDVRAVICDDALPGTSGLDFLLRLRRRRPRVAAILLTAEAVALLANRAVEDGGLHRCICKPWDGDEVRTSLRLLLEPKAPEETFS